MIRFATILRSTDQHIITYGVSHCIAPHPVVIDRALLHLEPIICSAAKTQKQQTHYKTHAQSLYAAAQAGDASGGDDQLATAEAADPRWAGETGASARPRQGKARVNKKHHKQIHQMMNKSTKGKARQGRVRAEARPGQGSARRVTQH